MNPLLFLALMGGGRIVRFVAECAAMNYLRQKVQTWPGRYFKHASSTVIAALVIALTN